MVAALALSKNFPTYSLMKRALLNSNAVVKTKRRNRAADAHTLLFWGIVGVALFALTACQSGGGGY